MLVLSRKAGEALVFKDADTGETLLTIKISLIRGPVVRIAVDAPKRVRVLRAELPEARATPQMAALSNNAPQAQPSPVY